MTETMTAEKMIDLDTILNGLSGHRRDTVYQAALEMTQACSQAHLKEIDQEIAKVRSKIDEVNGRREALSNEKYSLKVTREELKEVIGDAEPTTEVVTLLSVLRYRIEELQDRIDRMKPVDLLDRKVELQRRKEALRTGKSVGERIVEVLGSS